MIIIIPTRGRISNQVALGRLSPAMRAITTLVSPQSEVEPLFSLLASKGYSDTGVTAQPDENMTIAAKRHWIMDMVRRDGHEKVIMLDDDLIFYARHWSPEARNGEGDWRLHYADDAEVTEWMDGLFEVLSPSTPHAGFGPRQGNNNFPTGWIEGSRMMLALGYHVETALREAEWGRIETREDMDISLQLLRKGLPNVVNHGFCVGQGTYAAAGGCTGQRTTESSDADAEKLARLHPGFVSVVQKNYKGHPRKEVRVQWKRALAAGRAAGAL